MLAIDRRVSAARWDTGSVSKTADGPHAGAGTDGMAMGPLEAQRVGTLATRDVSRLAQALERSLSASLRHPTRVLIELPPLIFPEVAPARDC